MIDDANDGEGETKQDETGKAAARATEPQREPSKAAPTEADPLDLGAALTRLLEAERRRDLAYDNSKSQALARRGARSGLATVVQFGFEPLDDLQPTVGKVTASDGKVHDAFADVQLEQGWAAARHVRDLVDRHLAAARDHYLEARRAAADRATVALATQQVEFARRSTEAAEAMKASARRQATMAREQSEAAMRNATAAEEQTRIGKSMRWFTGVLIAVGVLQVVAAGAQVYVARRASQNSGCAPTPAMSGPVR